jgi:phage/plasmid-like protein (TIGR03299 family)
MIFEADAGVVWGTAWHNLPQYIQQETPVTIEQARKVLSYPVVKVPVFLQDGREVPGTSALLRTDINQILYPAVGKEYTVADNNQILDIVEQTFLKPYPELKIESVGTLKNGQTCFVNVRLLEDAVAGDRSSTVHNFAISQGFGGVSIPMFLHSTRIVCMNTLRQAEMQGIANKSLRRVRHTKGVMDRIAEYAFDLQAVLVGIEKQTAVFSDWATVKIDSNGLETYFDAMFPLPPVDEPSADDALKLDAEEDETPKSRTATYVMKKRDTVESIWDNEEDLQGPIRHTKYALFQATTAFVDHHSTTRGADAGYKYWSGLTGLRDAEKQRSYRILQALEA